MVTRAQDGKAPEDEMTALDLSAQVAERVQLRDVRCLSIKAWHDPDMPSGSLSARFSIHTTAVPAKDGFKVRAMFSMVGGEGQNGEQPDGDESVTIDAEFELRYSHPDACQLQHNALEAFGAVNGIYNAWPYWRELLQSMTVRMGLPPLVAPVFRIDDMLMNPDDGQDGQD